MPEDWQNGGFGLYLHWPFCQAKCPYCDFNSHVSAQIDQSRWEAAYVSELRRVAVETGDRILDTVFFGGGTPSLMSADLVHAVMDEIRRLWRTSNSFEVTLEANPTSVEAGRFRGYRDAGINRISMGIQALNDDDLRALGRLHSVAEAMQAFSLASEVFDRVSFDLIYARQHQTLAAWKAELTQAVSLSAGHLSLYQLTIEERTAFGDRAARGKLPGLPDEDLAADMYLATQEICAEAGLAAYEVSNHALPGQESRHNLIYWRYGDFAGIGPGAHGRLTRDGARYATDTVLTPTAWLRQVENTGSGEGSRSQLPGPDQAGEYLMMGLRLSEGISLSRYREMGGTIDGNKINELQEMGLVARTPDRLQVTAKGRPVLNAVIRDLLP